MNLQQNIQQLHEVWSSNKAIKDTSQTQISFDDLTNSIISTGPFSFYIIDFFDMSLSHISPSLYEMHGFNPETVTFNDILGAIHPEDIDFVVRAEAFLTKFFYEKVGRDQLLTYKISYSHRARLKNGEYVLFNHQALMLTMDDTGGYGKSLNIHTRIDHLSNANTYRISLIGLKGQPSYMNIDLEDEGKNKIEFSKREIDIIKLIGDGHNNEDIGKLLFISPLTVKTHRKNILEKSESKNTAQLIKNCMIQGII
ncbi:LuxR C-terminal-related transcriptional regulator [Chitinophaga sp. SYP-B3965]|uniref:LuxR C-terminal-related transcriptional regulator n=1 Tax=Chitinophaga sp. SYP-B3965 TaxID=2663120 RepID=UPI001C12CB4F|nr:LuxR C-terminal-related transcriptional regulator [Chitinophaga sp. SYP-B3965]